MAARTPAVNPESTWRLYSALAAVAGVSRPVRVDDPRVLAGLLRHGAGATALFVNCSPDVLQLQPSAAVAVDASTWSGRLEPFGVAAVPLSDLGVPSPERDGQGTTLTAVELTKGGVRQSEHVTR
jgi:hypothetical protein